MLLYYIHHIRRTGPRKANIRDIKAASADRLFLLGRRNGVIPYNIRSVYKIRRRRCRYNNLYTAARTTV